MSSDLEGSPGEQSPLLYAEFSPPGACPRRAAERGGVILPGWKKCDGSQGGSLPDKFSPSHKSPRIFAASLGIIPFFSMPAMTISHVQSALSLSIPRI